MKYLLNIIVEDIPQINRQVLVDEFIKLDDLCEYIIVSLNGSQIPCYDLKINKGYYTYDELNKITLKDLNLKKRDILYMEYNFSNSYKIEIAIDDIYTSNINEDFKILSGHSIGVWDYLNHYQIKYLFKYPNDYMTKTQRAYINAVFNVEEVNDKVNDYKIWKRNLDKPTRYRFNVSLEGFKEIKRTILVNSDITIDEFCRKVIKSMNGELYHAYGIKFKKNHLDEFFSDVPLYYLRMNAKDKLKITYDFGDNWNFLLTLSQIVDGKSNTNFEVISGKGYGIVEDCGGALYLDKVFSLKNPDWKDYDLNDFDLEKCNKYVNGGK